MRVQNAVIVHVAGSVGELAYHNDILAISISAGNYRSAVFSDLYAVLEYKLSIGQLVEVCELTGKFLAEFQF